MAQRARVLLAFILAVVGVSLLLAQAAHCDQLHRGFGELLKRHVHDGMVDYQGFKKDEAQLDSYLQSLAQVDVASLSKSHQLALYINGYNGYTIKLILENFDEKGKPPSSIKKIGSLFTSPWGISFAEIGGTVYTLDEIEHEIIRKEWEEPRIHFAVNCASRSCPPLLPVPYTGELIDEQLETATRAFLNDETMNYLEGNTLYLSSIFKWYKEDFKMGLVSFFIEHAEERLAEQVSALGDSVRVKYLKYDWSLNSR